MLRYKLEYMTFTYFLFCFLFIGNNYSRYGSNETYFAQAVLSNMLGGIGYFYGSSRVQSSYTKEPVPYWKAPLYTGVPSR